MGDIVNLRLKRKQKRRSEKEQRADQNRLIHGLSRSERMREQKLKASMAAMIEGHRREPEVLAPHAKETESASSPRDRR